MKAARKQFVLCVDNSGYEASLIPGKVYRMLPDTRAAKEDLVRIVDESGEDYLFEIGRFEVVGFPRSIERKLLALQAVSHQSR